MEITLEAIEKVMEATGVEYKTAKEALTKTNGNADEAIKLIRPDTIDIGEEAKAAVEKLKKKVEEGNVDRIQIRKDDEIVLSVPVNVGIIGGFPEADGIGKILVATGGTSDIPVAEEAALTAQVLGNEVVRLYDVGVAGIHRLLDHMDEIMMASVIIVIAGMEGALASVVGGFADCPVIAVPTSVGYGASFGGLSALLSMLNSCASGVSVVNIDNGFGAAYQASMINHPKTRSEK